MQSQGYASSGADQPVTDQGWGPGTVLANRYRLESLLGKGGMGSVWRAHHMTLDSPVALKLIDPSIAANPEARDRFMREAKAAATLRSPNVVQTFDFGVEQGVPFIAMELMLGESLAERLHRERVLDPAVAAHVMTQVSRAIGKAHEAGIVHRDLKPDNIFLVRNEDEEVAKVLDFGVAKATGTALGASGASKTRTGAILGTPYYMSPEQAQGNKSVDWRTDLWALAVITFECIVGRRPFESDGLGDLLMQICAAPVPAPSQWAVVPPGFDQWFARATIRDPAGRFQSAKEQAAALRQALSGQAVELQSGSYSDVNAPNAAAFQHQVASGSGGLAPAQSGIGMYAAGVPTPAVHTTSQLGATALPTVPKHRSAGLWLALGAVALLGALGAVALAVTLLGGSRDDGEVMTPVLEAVGPAGAVEANAAEEPTPTTVEPEVAASATASALAAPEPVATAPTRAASPAPRPRPTAAAQPAPARQPAPTRQPTPPPRGGGDRLGF